MAEYPELHPKDYAHQYDTKMYRGGRLLDLDVTDDIVDGMMSNKIVYEDMDYWFKSFPGEFERTPGDDVAAGVATPTPHHCLPGELPYVTGVDFTAPIGAPGMDAVVEGQVLTGTIEAMGLYLGLFVTVGNFWFAFVPVEETQWPDVQDDFRVGDVVTVRVWKRWNTEFARFPLHCELVDEALAAKITKPADYEMPVNVPDNQDDLVRMRKIMDRELPQDPLQLEVLPEGMFPEGTMPHEEYDAVEPVQGSRFDQPDNHSTMVAFAAANTGGGDIGVRLSTHKKRIDMDNARRMAANDGTDGSPFGGGWAHGDYDPPTDEESYPDERTEWEADKLASTAVYNMRKEVFDHRHESDRAAMENRMWEAMEETRIAEPETWQDEQYNRMQKELRIGPELTMAKFKRPTVAREQVPPPSAAPEWDDLPVEEKYRRQFIYQVNREAHGILPPEATTRQQRLESYVPWFDLPAALHPLDADEEELQDIERKFAAVARAAEEVPMNGLQAERGPWA